jgi:hypothetical protein
VTAEGYNAYGANETLLSGGNRLSVRWKVIDNSPQKSVGGTAKDVDKILSAKS